MKKVLALVLLFIALLTTGCSKATFDFDNGVLVVGLECMYAPFNWTETEPSETNVPIDGQNSYVEGYDVQIAKLLAADLGLDLVIKMVEWDSLILSLNSGMIDVIIAGMSPRPDRLDQINFTNAYYSSDHVVIVKKDGPFANATDLDDFAGAKIMGQKDTVYDTLAEQLKEKNNNAVHQTPLSSVPEIVNAVISGITDVTIVEKPVAISIANNNAQLKFIQLATPFEVAEEDKIVSIGVRKVDNDLKDALNASLAKISNEVREQLMLNAINLSPEA